MATIRNLIIRISVTENTDKGIRKVTTSLRETNREIDQADKGSSRFTGTLSKLGHTSMTGLTRGLSAVAAGTKQAAVGILAVSAAAASLNTATQAGVALAPLLGGLALLPAVAVSAATAVGVLKIATSGLSNGFKDAMKPGTKPSDLAKELKDVSPAARATVLELNKLRPTLLGIRNTIQQALFKPLVGQLTALAKTLGGPVKVGAAGVAAEFGAAGKKIAEFARQSKSVELVKAAFGQTQQAIANILPALDPLLKGFRALATEGLSFLPRIGTAIGQIGTKFGVWLQKMVDSGQATKWINNFFATLTQLGGVLKSVGGILSSVFSAASAAGSGFLGVLGAALAKLNAFLKTAAGQSALVSIFQGLAQIGQALAPIIAAVVKNLGGLAGPISRLAVQLGPILLTAINAIGPALVTLEPGLKALFGALGKAFTILAPVLPSIGKAISDIAIALAPVLPLAAGLAKVIAETLVAALKVLIPIVQPIIKAFSDALLPVLPQLSKAITDLVIALVPLAVALGPAFAKTITDLAPQFADIAVKLLTGLLPAFTDFVNAIVPFIPDLVRLSGQFGYLAVAVLPVLLPLLIGLAKISLDLTTNLLQLVPYADDFVKVLASIFTVAGIIPLLKNVGGAIGTVGNFIVGLPGKIVGALSWVVKNVAGAFSSAWNGAYNATTSVGQKLLNWIGGVPGAIGRFFSGAGSWLYNAGRNIVIGLWNGVVSLWNWLVSKFRSLTNLIPHIKGPPERDRRLLTPAGIAIMQSLGAGITSQIPALRTTLAGVTDVVSAGVTPRWAAPAGVAATASAGTAGGSSGSPDVKTLAAAISQALVGVGVHLDSQPVGQILSKTMGRQTDQRRRTG